MTKYKAEKESIVFTEPVDFDDIYDATTDIICKMYPNTEDLLEALSDIVYDSVTMDFREFFIDVAREQGMLRE